VHTKSAVDFDGPRQLRILRRSIPSPLKLRGGAKKKVAKKKKEKAIEPEEAVLDEFDEVNEADLEEPEEGVQKSQLMMSVTDMWVKTPPITQVYVGASLLLTTLVFALNKNAWPEVLNLDWRKVFTRFQIWRPFTAFLFFGPLGLNYLLTIQFVWTYMAQLEKMNYKSPEDFLIMMSFGAATLTTLYAILGLSTKFLGHNLSTFLVYIWARIFEGTDVNVMDLFLLKAEVLPWFFCAQTLVLEGEVPFADLLGIVVGHFYHYLTKRKVLKAPDFVKAWFSTESMKAKYLRFKDDFE
jgi:Derlin-2/3